MAMKDPSVEKASSTPVLDTPYVRLHITPLDPDLIKTVLSSALLPKARNISYHTIETFPEKRYGFLELPYEDAEKLRKKLTGATLKGVKIRIERAKPSRVPEPLGPEAIARENAVAIGSADVTGLDKSKPKKRKRDPEVLSGIVLKDGRKVKRGWTTAEDPREKKMKKDKEVKKRKRENEPKKQAKSKYTDHAECLVKTILPANVSAMMDATPLKKKKGKSREVTVHEFEKTTKFPTFLKTSSTSAQSKPVLEFVDGKGWVDENGNVVEVVKTRPPAPTKVDTSSEMKESSKQNLPGGNGSSIAGDDEASSDHEGTAHHNEDGRHLTPDSTTNDALLVPELPRPSSQKAKPTGPKEGLTIKIPPATPSEPKVHPLEALFKRPKQPEGEAADEGPEAKGFSFFGDNEEGVEEDCSGVDADGLPGFQEPLTPFTRKDLELRGIRSAAPTPDTAHPSRRFIPWDNEDNDEEIGREETPQGHEEAEALPSNDIMPENDSEGKKASDFEKWFWENRGELNRAWKRRRKLAGKEKRYRENKARMARAI